MKQVSCYQNHEDFKMKYELRRYRARLESYCDFLQWFLYGYNLLFWVKSSFSYSLLFQLPGWPFKVFHPSSVELNFWLKIYISSSYCTHHADFPVPTKQKLGQFF